MINVIIRNDQTEGVPGWWKAYHRHHLQVALKQHDAGDPYESAWTFIEADIVESGGNLIYFDGFNRGISHIEFKNDKDATLFLLRWG